MLMFLFYVVHKCAPLGYSFKLLSSVHFGTDTESHSRSESSVCVQGFININRNRNDFQYILRHQKVNEPLRNCLLMR